jgi:hypothetical protein
MSYRELEKKEVRGHVIAIVAALALGVFLMGVIISVLGEI